ncbi:hypothetical protein OHA98_20020 [Streptomyces sp. NBC_00654]|uniref:hypothetical protein n=1 Tax=Streptomyces sp. NBC_00654 TaxID=2975799 RepID=UPI00224CC488|nr:hypothetical protein [Streptomyces sp. NBC_00654]MCX4967055.1 hypothetical protein [Streptomyces sp. NBC_00654]
MQLLHTIEAAASGEQPEWFTVITGDAPEEHEGTTGDYGRTVLRNWISDEDLSGDELTDEYGNPKLRVTVAFADAPDGYGEPFTTVHCTELEDPAVELDAVDAARDRMRWLAAQTSAAEDQLAEALRTARSRGHGANELARRAAPAVSRPIALRMMRN